MQSKELQGWIKGEIAAAKYNLPRFVEDVGETAAFCLTHPRLALPTMLVVSSALLAACGSKESTPTLIPTQFPATETAPTATIAAPVGFEPSATAPATTEAISPQPTPTEVALEKFTPPTVKDMLVLDEGGAIPEYARPYSDAMTKEKSRIAQQLGVDADDINIFFKNNGSDQESSYRWGLWVQVKDKGVAWPLNSETGFLGDYPAYFQLDNPLDPEGPVHFDDEYDWTIVGSTDARMTFAGTYPIIADTPGKAEFDGSEKDAFSEYLQPGGLTQDDSKNAEKWQQVDGVDAEVFDYKVCTLENAKECTIPWEDLFNGKFLAFAEGLRRPFNPETMKSVPLETGPGYIIPESRTSPNFTDIQTIGQESGADFRRGITSAYVVYEVDGKRYYQQVIVDEYSDLNDPGNKDKNVLVFGINPTNKWSQGAREFTEEEYEKTVSIWRDRMKFDPIGTSYSDSIAGIVPLVKISFDNDPNMEEHIKEFQSGERSGLHGKVILLFIADEESGLLR